jgi:uncharacterized membrane protein YecN with MAPEG domain
MIRAYVVTFAFVTFRILSDYGPTSRSQPENDRSLTLTWVCWVVPLAATEMIFQLRRIKSAIRARARRLQVLQQLHAERTLEGQRG